MSKSVWSEKKELREKINSAHVWVISINNLINEMYILSCDNQNIFPSEESYKVFYTESLNEFFALKELSLKRVFDLKISIKEEVKE